MANTQLSCRYLIVIDDVWTVRAWEAIQSVLPENRCDSRIIVTTRIENVANACSPASVGGHYIHHMKPLTLEDSKKLFLMKAFGAMDARYPEELEDVMSDVLKKCGGLPLAIVSLASVFAGYGSSSGSKDRWVTICKSIGFQMESQPTLEGMKHIVTLSYNHLPYELKGCMMYLSIFPEDYEINKDRLLCRWVAEGLVPEKRGLTLMEVAESYLDELVNRNMIEVRSCFDAYWKAESCRVHDMLLEVMVSKSLEYNFVSLLGGQYAAISSYDRIRRLSIQGGGGGDGDDDDTRRSNQESAELRGKKKKKKTEEGGAAIDGVDVKHVRSLSIFQHGVRKLLDHLDKFALLSVLDLEGCEDLTNNHVRLICRLYLLRFLSLRGTDVSKVPPEVRKLEHLQTLDLWESGVVELPETVTKLGKLERLHLRNKTSWKHMWSLPRGLKNMRALRELGMVILGGDAQVAHDVRQLERLEDLKLFLHTEKISGNASVVSELAVSLSKLYSLRRLIIEDHGYYGGRYDVYRGSFILDFLHDLISPPRLLRCLKISGLIKCIPTWVGSLTYLVEFRVCWARLVDDQIFGALCKLPNLRCIQLEWDCYSGTRLVARTTHSFPSLTKLRVVCGAANPKVFQFEARSMPKLETLHINFARNRERSIVGIEHLTKLKEVQLTGAKDNDALDRALELLKADISRRRTDNSGSNQFQVSVQYWWA
ncbi:putative disease resistance RPP13-like protein 3 [Panicum miliaceum]|uniref:Disease resistance RPP13-like protein 3 n=1 Tax=Panicum miliaceum TaxID=4540 RepID=A0A3L6SP77_PANMI|nr:putative disease resistance RPP13-like protein 3 [Panicum miliaceum]